MTNQERICFLEKTGHDRLAYCLTPGQKDQNPDSPTLVWLNGFLSDMGGTKIAWLADQFRGLGWGFLRFDYFAHGATGGDFAEASVGRWRANVLSIIDELTEGPLLLIGSSMGGWLACLAALDRPDRVVGLGLVAPAPDFPTALLWPSLSADEQAAFAAQGYIDRGGSHPDARLSRAFFDESKAHNLLGSKIGFNGPVEILHGMQDDAVPWQHAIRLSEALNSQNVHLHLIKDGDHRLSRPQDLPHLLAMITRLKG